MLKIIRDNPRAFLFAVGIHFLLILFLSVNLNWTSSHEVVAPEVAVIQAVMIDESKIRAEEERKRKAEQEKRRREEAAKKRKEEEKRKLEQKKKAAAEAKRRAEAKKKEELRKKQEAEKKRQAELAEKKRKEEAERKRQAEIERQRKAEEERLRAEEERLRQEQIAKEQAAMEAAKQKALLSEREKYIFKIQQRVSSKWVRPSGWRAGISCKVRVQLVPGVAGTAQVINAQMVTSCGQALFDRSVENAVFSASPLPFPTMPELMNEFREITFDFKPED
jgi:colicin import membrane protein